MSYTILVHKDKVLDHIHKLENTRKHEDTIQILADNPYPGSGIGDKKQLSDKFTEIDNQKLFRIRSGQHRAIYSIDEGSKTIFVFDFFKKKSGKYGVY